MSTSLPPSSPTPPGPIPHLPPTPGQPHTVVYTQPVIIQQGGGRFGRIMNWLGWSGFIFCLFALIAVSASRQDYYDSTAGVTEKFHDGDENAHDKIAVLSITGLITDGERSFAKKQIEKIRKDDDVKAIVVRVNSPGGTVTGSDYILHHLIKLRDEKKVPLVVSMGSVAASGGYYVSMAVGKEKDVVFAEPTTTTGSIGVIMPHYDISGLMEQYKVKDDSIPTHPNKEIGAMTKPMSEEHRKILKEYIDESFARFKQIIRDGRPALAADDDALTKLATGQIFTAQQAKDRGLVDRIGFLEDAVARAAELANLQPDKYRVVKYDSLHSLFGLAGMAESKSRTRPDAAALLDAATPKAWYISNSLAPLIPLLGATDE